MSIKLSANIWQEDDQFVSFCPELGVSSFGANPVEALDMLKDAVELYISASRDLNIMSEQIEALKNPVRFQTTFEVEVA